MDEKEFQEIKARSKEIERFLRHGSYVQTLNDDVPKLVAEVEELRTEQEQLRGEIQSLKEEFSAFITKSDELLREMEDFQAVVQEGLEFVSGMFGSFNKRKSLGQLAQALSVSTVGHSNGRQARDDNNTGINDLPSSNGRSIAG